MPITGISPLHGRMTQQGQDNRTISRKKKPGFAMHCCGLGSDIYILRTLVFLTENWEESGLSQQRMCANRRA